MADAGSGPGFIPVADVTVDLVRPTREGFSLEGKGGDGGDYRLEMHLDLRVDARTRTVLSEMLSQSEWRISRRVRPPLRERVRRVRSAGPSAKP